MRKLNLKILSSTQLEDLQKEKVEIIDARLVESPMTDAPIHVAILYWIEAN